MKKIRFVLLAVVFLSFVLAPLALAQTEQLTLRMTRDWGYGGFNGDIQGLFSMKVTGPTDLARVEFYIDSTKIGEVDKAPFNLQFTTDDYPDGVHDLYAVGYSSSGEEYRSNVISAKFVPASEGGKAAMQFLVPVLGVVFGAMLLATLVPVLMGRKTINLAPGTPRKYGFGGAICPKCKRPFAMHLYGFNLGLSKFDRCPYCAKWSVVRGVSMDKLRAAEQVELEVEKSQVPEMSEEEKIKKSLDDSRFQGL